MGTKFFVFGYNDYWVLCICRSKKNVSKEFRKKDNGNKKKRQPKKLQ
jgi:hypothetical protein